MGELCTGREGSDGPAVNGECWRRDVDGECTDGEPDDMVPDLNALIGLKAGRRIGIGPGESCRWLLVSSTRAAFPNTLTVRPMPKLSRLNRAANADGVKSSLEPIEGVPWRIDDASDTPDTDPAVIPAPDMARVMGNATFCERGLLPVKDVVRACVRGGSINRSGTDEGGERGSDVRIGRLLGELASESRCWFLNSVGVNSGPSSCERNREDNSDSQSNILNSGVARYMVDTESVPRG